MQLAHCPVTWTVTDVRATDFHAPSCIQTFHYYLNGRFSARFASSWNGTEKLLKWFKFSLLAGSSRSITGLALQVRDQS
jgi:hypothetical protein